MKKSHQKNWANITGIESIKYELTRYLAVLEIARRLNTRTSKRPSPMKSGPPL